MRIPSPLVWVKAQLGSTAAKVELSVRSPNNGRFEKAFLAIKNGEARLTQAWQRGEVSEKQLVKRSSHLTDLRQALYRERSPMAHSVSMQNMLTRICNLPPVSAPHSLSGSLESLTSLTSQASRTSVSSRTSVASTGQFQQRAMAALADAVWSGQMHALKDLREEVLATAVLIAEPGETRSQSELVARVFDELQARAPLGSGLAGPEWAVLRYLRREMLTNSDGPGGRVATDRLVVDADTTDRHAAWLARPLPTGPAPPKPPRLGEPRAISLPRDWRPGESSA